MSDAVVAHDEYVKLAGRAVPLIIAGWAVAGVQ